MAEIKFSSRKANILIILGIATFLLATLCIIVVFVLPNNTNLNELIRPTEFSECISLIITVFSGYIGGHLATKIKYPPMLGMLVSGMMVRNIFPFLIVDIPHSWTAILWTFSLTSVVARAGLSLELDILRENAKTVFLLGIIPILFEASWLSTFSHRLFHLPKAWSNLLAFGVASISPGVVVPLILNLKDNPHWIGSKLPPIMIASVSIDVLVATLGFGASLKYAFQNETKKKLDMTSNSLTKGSLSFFLVALDELALGLLLSFALGLVAFLLKHLTSYRLLSFSLMFLLSALTMGWDDTHTSTGVASFSVIMAWATAANTWTKEDTSAADMMLKNLWDSFKLFLFPVIGASVSFSSLPAQNFLQCFGLVFSSVLIKFLATFLAGYLSDLKYQERIFISGIWTGKASVQAALCGAALEIVHARNLDGKEEENYAKLVFMCMLSAILIGCPAAGIWFSYFAQKPVGLNVETNDEV